MATSSEKKKKDNIRSRGEIMAIVAKDQIRDKEKALAPFNVGDTIKVHLIIPEEKKKKDKAKSKKSGERIQVFEGIVIGFYNGGPQKTFKVRKISYGIGVERTFPYHSPLIKKIEVSKRGKVRRAKLYYLRDRIGKAASVKRLDVK